MNRAHWARLSDLKFFGSVALWTGLLTLLAAARNALDGVAQGGHQATDWFFYLLPGWIGVLLPFAAFAGGVACHRRASGRSVLWRAASLSLITYILVAVLSPIALHKEHARSVGNVESVYPFGAQTPGGLLAHRKAILADPPDAFSFRASRPMALPPNWLTYQLHSSLALAIFTVLSALLGFRVAQVTGGLSPPKRLNARLALGFGSGLLFFVAMVAGTEWVRGDPSNSGVVGAWPPLLAPLLELVLLALIFGNPKASPDRRGTSPGW